MSKVRDLPENTSPDASDLLYVVDASTGVNASKKIKVSTLRTNFLPTAAETKTSYESNSNTNAFTDSEQTKLAGIEAGATADQLASEVPYTNTISGLSATNVQAAIDEVDGLVDLGFSFTIASGLIVNYTEGRVRFDGTYTKILAGAFLLNANVTDGTLYIDVDSVLKQTASSIAPPPYSVPLALFTTGVSSVLSLQDIRVKIDNNIIRGSSGNITSIGADNVAAAGSTYKLADAGHVHPVSTAIATTLTASSVDAIGTSNSLARADHVHSISSGLPSQQKADQTLATGTSSDFARADHIHNIPTAVVSSTGVANSQGTADTFAKSDHVHDTVISNATASATLDDTTGSLTDALIVSMTLTPASGTYLAIFGGSTVNSANGAERAWFSFYVGGVKVTATERSVGTSGGAYIPMQLSSIVTVNGSQALEVRWRVAAGTQTIRSRRLSLIRVG